MTKLDDLLRTMDHHAGQAADGAGLIEAAQRGAARIRRRRRITQVTAAATAVLLGAVGVPLFLRTQDPPPAPTADSRIATGLAMTLELEGLPGATTVESGTYYHRQFQKLIVTRGDGKHLVWVWVNPPGAPGADHLIDGKPVEPVTVRDRAGSLQRDGDRGLLIWQLADRTQVAVSTPGVGGEGSPTDGTLAAADRQVLLEVARAVRLGRARPLLAPVRLGPIPAGYQLVSVDQRHEPPGPPPGLFHLALSSPGSPITALHRINVSAVKPADLTNLDRITDIGGRPAWFGHPAQRWSTLVVRTPTCDIEFQSNSDLSRADLTRMAEQTEMFPCDQPATWKPPVK